MNISEFNEKTGEKCGSFNNFYEIMCCGAAVIDGNLNYYL